MALSIIILLRAYLHRETGRIYGHIYIYESRLLYIYLLCYFIIDIFLSLLFSITHSFDANQYTSYLSIYSR